jgi:catechol 2,3-dioxygenase-like lactoylglutathione lyase family enzyme
VGRALPEVLRGGTAEAGRALSGQPLVELDHLLTIRVRDLEAARRRFIDHLGMVLEFEVPGRRTVALQDDGGLTLFLDETAGEVGSDGVVLTIQVADVEASYRALAAKGVRFESSPARRFWGTASSCATPTGIWCCCGSDVDSGERQGLIGAISSGRARTPAAGTTRPRPRSRSVVRSAEPPRRGLPPPLPEGARE